MILDHLDMMHLTDFLSLAWEARGLFDFPSFIASSIFVVVLVASEAK